MCPRLLLAALACTVSLAFGAGACERQAAQPGLTPDGAPPPLTHYLGREIAPTMGHQGAPWLVRDSREAEEHTTELLRELRLSPGDVVCDFGAGVGYHTLPMAKLVAPGGEVLAVDIQQEMLEELMQRARDAGVSNVRPIRSLAWDPLLPPGRCDHILLVDVYHELDYPEQVLAGLRAALSPRGQLVLVEFRAEDPHVPIKPLHKLSKAQALKELGQNGLSLTRSYDSLPWQHVLFFVRR